MSISTLKNTVAPAAVLLTLILTGCGPESVGSALTDSGCRPGPTVYIIPDVSGSTAAKRTARGLYERAMMQALMAAARECAAAVYSAPADGNSIGNGEWIIDGKRFRQIVGGNETFSEAARANAAKKLLPDVRRGLKLQQAPGTDVLGSAVRIRLAIQHLAPHARIQIIWLTDGALNVPGQYSIYRTPIDTPQRRRRFVDRLAAQGEIPDFGGRADIYIGGLGLGLNRDKARDVIALWQLIVPAMNARLRSADASLRFP